MFHLNLELCAFVCVQTVCRVCAISYEVAPKIKIQRNKKSSQANYKISKHKITNKVKSPCRSVFKFTNSLFCRRAKIIPLIMLAYLDGVNLFWFMVEVFSIENKNEITLFYERAHA